MKIVPLACVVSTLCLAVAPCFGNKDDWSKEFSGAKPVVATRAIFSESPDSPYDEPLAKLFAGKEHIAEAHRKHAFTTGGKPIGKNEVSTIVSRHMLIDKFLSDATTRQDPHGPKRQVVILGAGFDSRANRLCKDLPVHKWFEIDLPAPQRYKEDVLRKNNISDPDNLTRIKLDLTADGVDWVAALEGAGWDPTVPSIFILEGLIYYMSTDQAKSLLHSIPSVPGSRIIVTVVEHSLQKVFERYGLFQWKTNLRKMKRAGGLKLPKYRKVREASVTFPQRYGLKVSVRPRPGKNWFKRVQQWIHLPCERILEYEGV